MAAPELSTRQQPAWRWSLPAGLPRAWGIAYLAVWTATLSFAAAISIAGNPLTSLTREILKAHLSPAVNLPPTIVNVLLLAAHNLPMTMWPLLLGVIGAHRDPRSRTFADTLLAVYLIANTLPVAAALATYGTALIPYIPQLPIEWAALALGASTWLVQRQR